jgi:hypothetical protein
MKTRYERIFQEELKNENLKFKVTQTDAEGKEQELAAFATQAEADAYQKEQLKKQQKSKIAIKAEAFEKKYSSFLKEVEAAPEDSKTNPGEPNSQEVDSQASTEEAPAQDPQEKIESRLLDIIYRNIYNGFLKDLLQFQEDYKDLISVEMSDILRKTSSEITKSLEELEKVVIPE